MKHELGLGDHRERGTNINWPSLGSKGGSSAKSWGGWKIHHDEQRLEYFKHAYSRAFVTREYK